MKLDWRTALVAAITCAAPCLFAAQAGDAPAAPLAPDWAQPGTATHMQVAPPPDFHRPSTNFDLPIGVFEGQSDIGSALVPGSASYDAATKQYTIDSAGYNVWYGRDEFRYLWKKMSGDVSLAADVALPNLNGYGDRKALLIIRQNLDDDSAEAMVAMHGTGLSHLAQRAGKGVEIKEAYRITPRDLPGGPGDPGIVKPKRLGIEKRGDTIALFASLDGEPMHQIGPSIQVHFDAPFYVGIGFCSHLPTTSDTAVLSDVVLENAAGKVH